MAGGPSHPAGDEVHVMHSRSKCFQPGTTDGVVRVDDPTVKLEAYALSEALNREETANPYLDAGDVVIVTEQAPIYVVRCVVNQRTIYSKNPVTLMLEMKQNRRPEIQACSHSTFWAFLHPVTARPARCFRIRLLIHVR